MPPTEFQYPVRRIAIDRTVRLVATARLRPSVLSQLVGNDHLGDLAEIEGATSTRLKAEEHGSDAIQPGEFIFGIPHAAFINAAFAYSRPRELNRFNGPNRGAWYAAMRAETCVAEVAFHLVRELDRANSFNAVAEYSEMFASFAGEFVDLREIDPKPRCLDPDPAVAYPLGNTLADATRAQGYNGIVYPSVRDPDGTCLVALWPHAVQSVAQGRVLRLTWSGSRHHTLTVAAG